MHAPEVEWVSTGKAHKHYEFDMHVVVELTNNFKHFLTRTLNDVSKMYNQEYVNEFVYWFNRRHWES